MTYKYIIYEKEGAVATITMNRPKALNAITFPLSYEILHAIEEVKWDDDVRALVITGAGRGFCSGDDLHDMEVPPRVGASMAGQDIVKNIRDLRKPVIAAVNGNAHGTGSDIMIACDFRIASEEAILGDIRMSRGIFIGTGATYMLPKLVGLAKAIELIFTGDTIGAREAERIGLVNKTVPVDTFKAEVMALANKLARGPTKSIGAAKAEIYRQLNMDLAQAMQDELNEMGTPWYGEGLWASQVEDFQEGIKSFTEKRKPTFTGK